MILVRYIDVMPWQGPRHQKLRSIWRAIKKLYDSGKKAHIRPFRNPGKMSHADCLATMWRHRPSWPQYLLITEMDFLPTLRFDTWLDLPMEIWRRDLNIFAPVKQRVNAGDTETWFLLADLQADYPELRWDYPRDPGADLHEQTSVQHYTGRLGEGGTDSFGWHYPWGVHLLGSRHLHDPPATPLWEHDGRMLTARDLQENHDAYVARWIEEQPDSFKELLA